MRYASLLATTVLAAGSAAAQQPPAPADEPPPRADDHVHEDQGETIVVTATGLRDLNLLAGTSTLSGSDLIRDMRAQIGDTLTRLPGVSATSFGPGASRPVLRGFQGERVRVLVDGIGSIDVSNTSADHAVTIDPITSDRIEVLHGPAVLLFGSQAIGGAVNVFDRRIPRRVPDDPIHIDAIAGYGSAADEWSAGAGLDFPVTEQFVVHVDGSWRDSDDLRIGGFVLSPELRAEELARAEEEESEGHVEEAEEAREFAALRGRLPNSATRTWTAGIGAALIGDRGNLGFSFSAFDSRYGVPARPGAGHHHEEEGEEDGEDHAGEEEHAAVTLDLRQYRGDLRAEIETGGFIDRIRVRLAAADYEHTEFEGDEVGTIFRTQGLEGRVEAVQTERGGWRGIVGAQFFLRDFEAIGAEAFVPPNDVRQIGFFALQEAELGQLELEGAIRFEQAHVAATSLGLDRDFRALSLAAGASYEVSPQVRIGANVSRSERAPSAEELFSNGPHVATQAFEVGDPTLLKERSLGGELYARATVRGFRLNATVYANRFDNYIFQAETGEEADGLPVFQYFQSDATHWGLEFGATVPVAELGRWRIVADAVADYVRATIAGSGPVPRIPPLRLLAGLEAESDAVDGRIEIEHTFDQNRVAAFETPTDGFTLVNASVTWRPWGRRNPTSLIFSANNLLDAEARRHASFTKDFVPLAGRDFRVSARISF